jgi:hypothetical protein
MRFLSWYTLMLGAGAALLAGCGGSQTPIGVPGAVPQSQVIATHAERGGSWMLAEAKREDLLYVSGGCQGVCILSYPSGKLVGSFSLQFGLGACTDGKGSVFFASGDDLEEFAHGGTAPVATFSLPNRVFSCAIDQQTGNLAVTYFVTSGANVAVFPAAQGPPTYYYVSLDEFYCSYDSQGNLFVDGYGKYDATYLAELPKNADAFSNVSITPYPSGSPGQVQWDGKYLTLELLGPNDGKGLSLARLSISGSVARIVNETRFDGKSRSAGESWIQGGAIFIPYGWSRVYPNKLGVWKYPRGGKPVEKYQHFAGQHPGLLAVAYSPAAR